MSRELDTAETNDQGINFLEMSLKLKNFKFSFFNKNLKKRKKKRQTGGAENSQLIVQYT